MKRMRLGTLMLLVVIAALVVAVVAEGQRRAKLEARMQALRGEETALATELIQARLREALANKRPSSGRPSAPIPARW